MSFTPFNAPLLSGLLGDMEIAGHFSVKADIAAMLNFEAALAKSESDEGIIPEKSGKIIINACKNFDPDVKSLSLAAKRDGMAVPDFIAQLRDAIDEPHSQYLHFGSTSQDVVDTSLTLRLRDVNAIFQRRLGNIIELLSDLGRRFGDKHLMARTRMQAALPITAAHRLSQWQSPLVDHGRRLSALSPSLHAVQCGGPVGTFDKPGERAEKVRANLADALNLSDPGKSWHTDRSRLIDYANWLSQLSGSLGKIGKDVVLMAQNEISEIGFDGGGGSSAMAHKHNPVKAETLIALAHFNATLASGMHHCGIHEQERSGAMWTLEWMLLPQLCVATGAALNNAQDLLQSVTFIGKTV